MTPLFDETHYLATYPDVADAVRRGDFASGQDHFLRFGQHEGREPTPPHFSIESLLASPATDQLFLELTSRCNLRCVYCAVSQPTYRGIDLRLDAFDAFLEQMKSRSVRLVTLNGHGESTMVKEWAVIADRLADDGFRLHLTTNLAKRLEASEISALSRFEMILVSIDTIDPDLLACLRRGLKLETLLENVELIQRFSAAHGRRPEIAISCTVGDLSAPGIGDLVDAMLARGITTFRFGDLAEYAPIQSTLRMRHVSALAEPELAVVRERFCAAIGRIEAAGAASQTDSSLVALLLGNRALAGTEERSTKIGDKAVHSSNLEKRQTRDCLDPWRLAFVQADASVRPCCFFEEKLGTLEEQPLGEIVEGEAFRQLRREIATGELRANCRSCSGRPAVDVDVFARKLQKHLQAAGR